MANLHRLVIGWSGTMVQGAAVSVLHFDATTATAPPVAAIKSAFTAAALLFPAGLTITVPGTGDKIDAATGNLVGSWSSTGGGTVAGSNNSGVAAGVGAVISWSTDTIVTGSKGPRRVRGRTFLVPMSNAVYDTDGTFTTSTMTSLNTLAQSLYTAGDLRIWHRPTTTGGTDGAAGTPVGYRVRDKVAFLSSRRD